MGHRQIVDQDHSPHNGVSDQKSHCLLTECSILNYPKENPKHTLNWKWARPYDKDKHVNLANWDML